MYVDIFKRSFDRRKDIRSGTGRVLEETHKVLFTNWVCAGAFVDHEWVSTRTIFQQEEDILSMALDFKIDVPCVVHWNLLCFSAPTDLNRILGTDLKIQKIPRGRQWCYHGRFCETIWRETYTEVVYVKLGGQGPTTHKERERERGIE